MSSVEVQVKTPGGAKVTVTADPKDSVSILKQYVLALGPLVQPYTAFQLARAAETATSTNAAATATATSAATNFIDPAALVGDLAADAETLELEMVAQPQTLADVTFQIEQVRDALGLAPCESTYVNGGATRLHELKRGSKKSKKMGDDELVELAEVPADEAATVRVLANATTNEASNATTSKNGKKAAKADLGKSDPTHTVGGVAAYPNRAIPAPAAADLRLARWQPLCRTPQLKLQGILAFVHLVNNAGKEFFYAATPKGYTHVPNLTSTQYAEPAPNAHFVPTLIQALEQTSPATVSSARKHADKAHADPLSSMAVPQVASTAPWLVAGTAASREFTRASAALFTTPASDESVPHRDWNEDFQAAREASAETLGEKIARDRTLAATASEFAAAALEGATGIVEGAVRPLNEGEADESAQLFFHRGIFYTHGSSFVDAFAGIESTAGAEKAVKKGVRGVEQLMAFNSPGLAPILTAVVDYCGRSLVAQAPVPGIFRDAPLIVYGVSEDQETVHFDAEVDEAVQGFAESLHLKQHVVDAKGLQLRTSAEVHGARSTDGRLYVIDLHRLLVPDLGAGQTAKDGSSPSSPNAVADDELNLLRSEAIAAYFAANPDAGALNPDVWMSASSLPSGYAAEFAADVRDVARVGAFVRETLAPAFVADVAAGAVVDPLDGRHLTSLLHRNGIGMRLLGLVHALAIERAQHNLAAVALEEAVARALKVQLRAALRGGSAAEAPSIVEKFTARFVAADSAIVEAVAQRLRTHFGFSNADLPAEIFARASLLRAVSLQCGLQWTPELKLAAVNPVVEFSFPRSVAAMESLAAARMALESSVQKLVEQREAAEAAEAAKTEATAETAEKAEETETDSETKTEEAKAETEKAGTKESTESESKDSKTESKDAGSSSSASAEESAEDLANTISLNFAILSQAVGIYTQTYGNAHAEVAQALNQVATLFFEYSEDHAKAIDFVRRAITIAERVQGVDSHDVAVMYGNLAYFERSAGHVAASLAAARRVVELYTAVAQPGFRDLAAIYTSVGAMLLQHARPKVQAAAAAWLHRGVDLAKKNAAGPSGRAYFQLAQSQLLENEYAEAARSMDAAYRQFKQVNGPDDANTKEVKTYLEQLLRVTVAEQRKTEQPKAVKSEKTSKSEKSEKSKSEKSKKSKTEKTKTEKSKSDKSKSDKSKSDKSKSDKSKTEKTSKPEKTEPQAKTQGKSKKSKSKSA